MVGILDRLGTTGEYWQQRITRVFAKSQLLGNYFATSPERLSEIAARRGVHRVENAVILARAG